MTTVRIYGRVTNWGSHAQVTEGFRLGLEAHGALAGVYPVDLSVDEEQVPGGDAEVGIVTGPLGTLSMLSPAHRRRMAMVAPNSSLIPPALAMALDSFVDTVLAPSAWAEEVLRRQLKKAQVLTVPHGVHPDMQVDPGAREAMRWSYLRGGMRLVHFSTTDRGRKGTIELLRAWRLILDKLPEGARLFLVLDPNAKIRLADDLQEHDLSLEQVEIQDRLSFRQEPGRIGSSPKVMADVLSRFHCVVQPSRGEGFGLIPLEARACGVPVIATCTATGHREHLRDANVRDGVVRVPVGPDAPIDDVPGAMAPSLDPKALGLSILQAVDIYADLHEAALAQAEEVQNRWSWRKVLRPLIKEVTTA